MDLFGGFLSLLLGGKPEVGVKAVNWSTLINETTVQSLIRDAEPDPIATAIVKQQIDALATQGFAPDQQGIWIWSGDRVLAENLGTIPLSAASLTKIATTLVALNTWGPDHHFETIVSLNGKVQGGVLQGDLVVQGGSDPFFVWEEAIVLGNALTQLGIQRITGDLLITGDFVMNFETDPITAGTLLKQGFDANLWTDEVETQYQQLPPGTPRPQIPIGGGVKVADAALIQNATPLMRHQSLPLVNILRGMNIYSNNIIADSLANTLGGANVVAAKSAELIRVPPEEIQLINGSGLGEENRISPRAVTAMLIATQQYLQPRQLSIADVFPVVGQDGGTMKGRNIPAGSVLKTGTLDAVSSLAGVIPTRDRGLVWFTLIDLGTGDLQLLHDQQDALLQNLQQAWGTASPLPPTITPNPDWQRTFQLGAVERNQKI